MESNHRCILPGSDDDLALIWNGSGREALVSQRENGLIDRGYYALARLDGVGISLVLGRGKKKESKWPMIKTKFIDRTSFISGRVKCVEVRISRINIVHVKETNTHQHNSLMPLVDSGIQPDRLLYFFFQIFNEILRRHYHKFTIK